MAQALILMTQACNVTQACHVTRACHVTQACGVLREVSGESVLSQCVPRFPHCCALVPEKQPLTGGSLILSHSSASPSPLWWGSPGSRSARHLGTLQLQAGSRRIECGCSERFFLLIHSKPPVHGMAPPKSTTPSKPSSQTHPKHFYQDSKFHQVDIKLNPHNQYVTHCFQSSCSPGN